MDHDEFPNNPEPAPELSALYGKVALVKIEAEHLNQVGEPTRSRSLSNAITRLEEAMHWVEDAYRNSVMEASRQ